MAARTGLLLIVLLCAGCGGPSILTSEPGGGGLGRGESVLVDDGKCPAGQVNQVTGAPTLTGTRSYACVAKR